MSKKSSLIILGIALMLVLGSMQVGGTGTYFSDTETSTGNTFQAWVWHQADDLVVDKSGAELWPWPSYNILRGITIENDPENSPETSGEYDITIDALIVSWTPNGADIRMVQIWLEDGIEWTGEKSSGEELDIRDCTLSPGEKRYIDFTFDRNMEGKSFTIEFIMSDGSTLVDPFGPVNIAEEEPTPIPEPTSTPDDALPAP